jgi:hypothetical protein
MRNASKEIAYHVKCPLFSLYLSSANKPAPNHLDINVLSHNNRYLKEFTKTG